MKKGIRIAFFSLLIFAGAGIITWFLLMRRQVPQHAQCIPKNVVAVLTLNLRELALDHASGGHLFPELANDGLLNKELDRFMKAVEKNDGPGISKTADVLAFFYHEGDAAFFGVAASVKDSAKFGRLVREQLSLEFPFHPAGNALMGFDSSSAVLGWNTDIALFLYPFSNENSDKTSAECLKLLKQTEAQSILADENFRAHELSSFDAGLWMQPQRFLEFTGGAALQRVVFNNVKYLSLAMDFQNGELVMRKIITTEKPSAAPTAPVLLTCDPKQVRGFFHSVLDLQNDSLLKDYVNTPPMNMLQLDDERAMQLAKTLDGNFTVLIHDTFSFDMDYITYDYDADFNRVPKHGMKRVTERGSSISFGVKDTLTAKKLLTQWMKDDSIPLIGNTWLLNTTKAPHYMMLTNNVLTVANWKQADGKPREIPVAWEGLDAFLPVGNVIIPEMYAGVAFFFPQIESGEPLLRENVGDLLISQPLVVGNEISSQIRLTMRNKEVNALVQFEELVRKISR